jgi:hypothetical protein
VLYLCPELTNTVAAKAPKSRTAAETGGVVSLSNLAMGESDCAAKKLIIL